MVLSAPKTLLVEEYTKCEPNARTFDTLILRAKVLHADNFFQIVAESRVQTHRRCLLYLIITK